MRDSVKNLLTITRNRFELACKGVPEKIAIPLPPREWEKFPLSNSRWKEIDFNGENYTGCLFEITEDEEMFHSHEGFDERVTIMNKGGEVELLTQNEKTTYTFPQSFYIESGLPHHVKMKKGTLLQVVWSPKMVGQWTAENF